MRPANQHPQGRSPRLLLNASDSRKCGAASSNRLGFEHLTETCRRSSLVAAACCVHRQVCVPVGVRRRVRLATL